MERTLTADFSAPLGHIRPLHGVNSGPMTKVFTYDARPLFREAGFPYARMHDVEYPYGSGEFVDIPCIFKNFEADETDPANYNFALTDLYLARTLETGCEPFFRLGVSIEHAPVKRYIYPPADTAKWARICEHIIRHYTEGWADGYRWHITYWEIWNEPDGNGNMWLGTPEAFYAFYAETARHLKACFPHLKIGGAAFCRGVKPFMVGFMDYLQGESEAGRPVPLDFYSWHRYFADIKEMTEEAAATRALLDAHGYRDTESVFDEWNYMLGWELPLQCESYPAMKNHIGAAYHAAVLSAMQQETDIAVGCYFEADVVKEFCGIFDVSAMAIGKDKHAVVGPTKGFYPFKYFNALYRLGHAVRVEGCGEGLFAVAAAGEKGAGLMAANCQNTPQRVVFSLKGLTPGTVLTARMTDARNTDRQTFSVTVPAGGALTLPVPLPPYGVLWLG